MSVTPSQPATAVEEYQKVLTLYSAGDTVGAAREALKNVNQPFCPRYFQVKNLLVVGTLIEDEVHSLHYFTMAGEVKRSLAEDVSGSSSGAEQMVRAIGQEIDEAGQRRAGAEGPLDLGEKAFAIEDYSALGLAPELDVSMGLRDRIKQGKSATHSDFHHLWLTPAAEANGAPVENEVASPREEVHGLSANKVPALPEMAAQHTQTVQPDNVAGRGNGAYSVLLNSIAICIVVVVFFCWNKSII